MKELENTSKILTITEEEAYHLLHFFYCDGYLSHEFHEPTHNFINKLSTFLGNPSVSIVAAKARGLNIPK